MWGKCLYSLKVNKDFIVVVALNKFWRAERRMFWYDKNVSGSVLITLFVLRFPVLRNTAAISIRPLPRCIDSFFNGALQKHVSACVLMRSGWHTFPLGNQWFSWIEFSSALQKRHLWISEEISWEIGFQRFRDVGLCSLEMIVRCYFLLETFLTFWCQVKKL